MTTPTADKRTLIDELDARQDEVLAKLDELNAQIEALLTECLAGWSTERQAE